MNYETTLPPSETTLPPSSSNPYETLPPPDPNATYTINEVVQRSLDTLQECVRMYKLLDDQAAAIQQEAKTLNQRVENLRADIAIIETKPDFIINKLEELLAIKI